MKPQILSKRTSFNVVNNVVAGEFLEHSQKVQKQQDKDIIRVENATATLWHVILNWVFKWSIEENKD